MIDVRAFNGGYSLGCFRRHNRLMSPLMAAGLPHAAGLEGSYLPCMSGMQLFLLDIPLLASFAQSEIYLILIEYLPIPNHEP